MTEISTNEVKPFTNNLSSTEDIDCSDDLDPKDQRFYLAIVSHLSSMQVLPKEETVLKIINYSKTFK